MRKIGILCACEKELNPYIADMQDIFTTEYAMHTFYHGKIKDINIVAVYSGCGKINAAITAQQLIDKYEVDTIIFSGIAGGMKEEIGIFDTVVCTSSEFRDTDNEIYTDFPIMDSPVFYADEASSSLLTAGAPLGASPTRGQPSISRKAARCASACSKISAVRA